MAAFMADYELFQIEITRTYAKNEWRDDIRKLFRKSGIEGSFFIDLEKQQRICLFKLFHLILFVSFFRQKHRVLIQ